MTPEYLDADDDAVTIGRWHGVAVEVAPRDAVTANVAITIAGMFTHELSNEGPAGGLLHLDTALGGAITRLRSDGIFGAALGELLTLSAPAPPICACTVLAVGLGDPRDWTPARMRIAVAAATREALRLNAPSAAFAPSLIDSGLAAPDLAGAPDAMLSGLIDSLPGAAAHALSRWVFCTGAGHLIASVRDFRMAFDRRMAS